jgi:hypothetical protein
VIVFKSTSLTFRSRFDGPDGLISDYIESFGPDSLAFGRTFAEWAEIPDGPVEVVPIIASDTSGSVRRFYGRLALMRKIITPEVGDDGLFVQTDAEGADRERDEAHNRDRFANHFHYADPYAGNTRTFDPRGDYNCGRCNMANGDKCLLVALKAIDPTAGSCGDWENQCAGDAEMPLGLKDVDTAGYGIAENGKGFGCSRCPFASKAYAEDSQGRDLYCGKGDFRVYGNACCGLNGAPVVPIDDKGIPTSR